MIEKDMQTIWTNYIKSNPPEQSECYELKICKNTALPFNSVKEHQIFNLVDCETNTGLYYKIPDMTAMNSFSSPKPFDCFFIRNTKSYIIIWFYKPRQPKVFYKISIWAWLNTIKNSKRKSITEDTCKLIANERIEI